MVYPPELLDKVQRLSAQPWEGVVFRHMINDYPPDRANTRGARWNPSGVAAIYSSLEHSTALAEGSYRLSLEPFKPRVRRVIYRIRVRITRSIDLRSMSHLEELGVGREDLQSPDFASCQIVGGAVAWLEHDGLFIPSARSDGVNLVMFPNHLDLDSDFEILGHEDIL